MVSELTTRERFEQVAAVADGYVYIVPYLGVTGVENSLLEEKVADVLRAAREHTSLPLCVGSASTAARRSKRPCGRERTG